MPFLVGLGLIGVGGLLIWGGLSGRLAKMVAAVLPSGTIKTTAFTAPATGYQQLTGLTVQPTSGSGTGGFLASASTPSAGATGTASIPQWESASLSSLASGGSLNGVPAIVLAGIDQAESGGQGGYINSSGYGGFFGLGSNTQYPTGKTTPSLLTATDPQSFAIQAQITAGEFASLLGQTGGDAYAAERLYQGGSSEGTSIFSQIGVPATINIGAVA